MPRGPCRSSSPAPSRGSATGLLSCEAGASGSPRKLHHEGVPRQNNQTSIRSGHPRAMTALACRWPDRDRGPCARRIWHKCRWPCRYAVPVCESCGTCSASQVLDCSAFVRMESTLHRIWDAFIIRITLTIMRCTLLTILK